MGRLLARCLGWIKWSLLVLLGMLLLTQLWLLGWVLWWKWVPPQQTHFMSLRLDELRQKTPDPRLSFRRLILAAGKVLQRGVMLGP